MPVFILSVWKKILFLQIVNEIFQKNNAPAHTFRKNMHSFRKNAFTLLRNLAWTISGSKNFQNFIAHFEEEKKLTEEPSRLQQF